MRFAYSAYVRRSMFQTSTQRKIIKILRQLFINLAQNLKQGCANLTKTAISHYVDVRFILCVGINLSLILLAHH